MGEERSFNHVADCKKIVGSVQSFLCEPVSRLAECNNPSNKCKDGPHFFERMAVRYLSTFQSVHSLVVVLNKEWLATTINSNKHTVTAKSLKILCKLRERERMNE